MPMQRIIPREFGQKNPPENTQVANSLFFIGGILVFSLVVLAGALFFFLISSEKGKQEDLRSKIREKADELRASEVIERAVDLEARLASVRETLGGHVFGTNAIRLMENVVHPRVRFGGFSFSAEKRTVVTTATAKGFSAVTQQIEIMKRDSNIERVDFGGLSADEKGDVAFSLSITLTPAFVTTLLGSDFGLPVSSSRGSSATSSPSGATP